MVTNEKQKLLTWQTTRKKTKVTVERDNKVMELPEDRVMSLCSHDDGMQVVSRDQHSVSS